MTTLTVRRAAWIVVGVLAVFGLRLIVGGTGDVRIGFLFVVPVGMAGWWLGRRVGLGVAATCIGLYVIAVTLRPVPHPAAAAGVRAAVLIVGAIVAAELRVRTERLALTAAELDAVRQALTPASLPRLPGLDVALSFLPATHGVSGDFYLLTNGPHGINIAIVGDVTGHGPRAARTATFARATLASMAANSSDPAEILHLVNQAWSGGGATRST
jgi:Stage II sporulation protein E (SpoIIE)